MWQADIPAYHKTLTLFDAIQIPGNLWAVGKRSELEKHQKQQPIQAAPTELQSLAKNREALDLKRSASLPISKESKGLQCLRPQNRNCIEDKNLLH